MSLGMCSGGNRAVPWSSHTFILDGASGDPVGILGSKPDAFTVVFIPELSVVVVGTHICSVQCRCFRPIAGLLPRVGLSGLRVGDKRLWWGKVAANSLSPSH